MQMSRRFQRQQQKIKFEIFAKIGINFEKFLGFFGFFLDDYFNSDGKYSNRPLKFTQSIPNEKKVAKIRRKWDEKNPTDLNLAPNRQRALRAVGR